MPSAKKIKMTQFICKKCSYVNSTQEAIAVHYLQEHLGVDFCSLSNLIDVTETMPQEAKLHSNAFISGSDGKELEVVPRRGRSGNRSKIGINLEAPSENRDSSANTKSNIESNPSKIESSSPGMREKRGRGARNKDPDIKESINREASDSELGRGKRKRSTPKRFITEDESQKSFAEKRSDSSTLTGKDLGKKGTSKSFSNKKGSNSTDSEEEILLPRITRHQRNVAQGCSSQNSSLHSLQEVERKKEKLKTKDFRPLSRRNLRASCRFERKKQIKNDEPKEEKTETLAKKIEKLPIPYKQFKCKLDIMLSEWNTTQEQKKKDSIRKCTFAGCSLEMSEDELSVHVSCHAKSMDGLRCPQCPFMCLFWRHMRKHLRKEHSLLGDRVFQCDQANCDSTFVRCNQLRKHVMDKHLRVSLVNRLLAGAYDSTEFDNLDNQENVPSRSCKRKSNQTLQNEDSIQRKKKRRLINKHEDSENANRDHRSKVTFVCDLCLSKFKDEDMMESHKKGHFSHQENVLHCVECGADLTGGDKLKDHYREEHKRFLMRYQCQECPFATDRFHQINSHQAVHTGQKEVMCDQCGKLLANQYNLKVHEFRKHSTEEQKTVVCSACPYRCADKSVLRDHIKQHHKSMLKNPIYHRCPHCDYVGHKLKSLQFHMRIHTEQRSFKCTLCPYAGKTKNHLKIHLQTHADFKITSCPHCDFKGASKKRLSEHLMSQHLKVEPYLCKVCEWRTAYSGNMWKHISHHKKTLGEKMPDNPVTVELELLKDVELPEMPKAPTGKTREKTDYGLLNSKDINSTLVAGDGHNQGSLYIQGIPGEQGGVSASDLQVLQITGGSHNRTYIPNEIQIVQIQDDGLGQMPEQVVAHFHQGVGQGESVDNSKDQESHMEILISHEAAGHGSEMEKTVKVLRVGEDGTLITSSMNRDVEVAVLALAHLEPSTHAGEAISNGGGDEGQITILQTVQQNGDETGSIQGVTVSAATTAGIDVEASEDSQQSGSSPAEEVAPDIAAESATEQISTDDVPLSSLT